MVGETSCLVREQNFWARLFNSSYLINEDGFIAYVERIGYRLSFVSDRRQAYYQACGDSRLRKSYKMICSEDEYRPCQENYEIYKSSIGF